VGPDALQMSRWFREPGCPPNSWLYLCSTPLRRYVHDDSQMSLLAKIIDCIWSEPGTVIKLVSRNPVCHLGDLLVSNFVEDGHNAGTTR
jgi:hypothetical protein